MYFDCMPESIGILHTHERLIFSNPESHPEGTSRERMKMSEWQDAIIQPFSYPYYRISEIIIDLDCFRHLCK